MPFPISLNLQIPELYNNSPIAISINSGLTVLVGPNGSGKTQFMRGLKNHLNSHAGGRKVRFLSAGRLSVIENYRSDFDGQRGGQPNYEDATFGGTRYKNYRHSSETAYGDFHTLSLRPDIQIKVAERLKKLFKRNIYIEWDSGNLKVKFSRLEGASKPYSSAREASGLLHLVVILSALYDDEVGVLLVDEPELSLHPQLQSFLYQELKKVSGDPANNQNKIIVIGTHSTEFVEIKKAEEISNIIFFKDVVNPPSQILTNAPELQDKKLQGLLTRIGQNQKLAFFSKRPLLVEGQSDAIICLSLESRFNLYLGAAGSQIIPVIGKGQLPIVNKLFRLIGKEPIILCDLDTIADGVQLINSLNFGKQATEYAAQMGHSSIVKMASGIFSDFSQLISNNWTDINSDAEQHFYWKFRKADADEVQTKKRASLGTLFTADDDFFQKINNGEAWRSIRTRFEALFKILSKTGCFILKKGTIENYYINPSFSSLEDKPELAVEEAEVITTSDIEVVKANYSEVIECLQYASNSPEIDEAAALSDLVLSVAAPIVARITDEITTGEVQSLAYQILSDKSSILTFDISGTNGNKKVVIGNKSIILDVEGFPIEFSKDTNPVTEVKRRLKPKK
jgi:hypothetical protein